MEEFSTTVGSNFDQVAFVVDDLEAGQELFGRMFGIFRWSVWPNLAEGQADKTYYGEPEEFQFSCAYAYAGEVQIELCKHDSGRSIYADWTAARGPGLHHIGFTVNGEAEFERVKGVLEAQGARNAMGGRRPGRSRYAYFDTVETLGCYTEIYYISDPVKALFARMKNGEVVERP
jgi:catechol 2,3-dioxygenase-like lactoylglutathione lyase family enzyme